MLVALLIQPVSLLAASPSKASSKKTKTTCQEQIALVNYRADLLVAYKKSENIKYQTLRNKWATRISYAAQWVPKDAEKTRKSLYEYDDLHAATNKELSKQINSYRFLQNRPLDCSNARKAELARRVEDIKGLKGKKVVSGNALINQYKKKETKFLKNNFKKTSEKMVNKLHKVKTKDPAPKHPKLRVT